MSWQAIAIIAIVVFGVLPLVAGGIFVWLGFREARKFDKEKW